MNPILETVRDHLTKHELTPVPLGDGEALIATVTLKHLRVHLFFCADTDQQRLNLMGRHSVLVPEDRRAAVAEFITRLNWNLSGARFLLDHGDGEVCCRVDLEAGGAALNDATLSKSILRCCHLTDGFFPALMSVIYRGTPPVQALEQG
ncbi:MAG: hypothetical protein EBU54_15545, partial [Mycobacteriaceae bacterium]|nr:hypothetical protein [Mycobacteriaceae bacterium]